MSATGGTTPRRSSEEAFSWIGSLFTFKREQIHLGLAVAFGVIFIASLLMLRAIGRPELWLSFAFGFLYTALSDIAVTSERASRVRWSVTVAVGGALLTALGYLLGGANWFLVTLAVFVSTMLSYLVGAYGKRAATAGVLLNSWFVVVLASSLGLGKTPAQTLPLVVPQALAWLAGGALWLALAWGVWMARRSSQPSPAPAAPLQDSGPAQFSRPLVTFALIAAIAVALATAVTWGFHLPYADWMPIAAIVAMKPTFDASTYRSGQRVAGAILGGLLAALLLSAVHNDTALAAGIVLFAVVGAALHEANYAIYYTCMSAAVLLVLSLSHPGTVSDIWARTVWALVGVLIALGVTFLAGWVRDWEAHRTAIA